MPFRIKPWHCIAVVMLGLIAYVSIVWDHPMTWEEHTAKMWGYEAEFDEVMRELNALSEEFHATLSPSDRAAIRGDVRTMPASCIPHCSMISRRLNLRTPPGRIGNGKCVENWTNSSKDTTC